MNSQREVNHFFPTCMMVFVNGFGEVITEEAVLAFSDEEIKEISNLNISLTVKNNPGTFSATLIDTNNKFIIPDNPDEEIAALKKLSDRKIYRKTDFTKQLRSDSKEEKFDLAFKKSFLDTVEVVDSANYYTYLNYNNWLEEKYIIYVESGTGKKYPSQFIRSTTGNVTQRWVFNSNGDIIILSNSESEENSLLALFSEGTVEVNYTANIIREDNDKGTINVVLRAYTNFDLVEGKYKDIYEQGEGRGRFNKGRCKIAAMDRVVIFLPPRFKNGGVKNQGPNTILLRAFTGVVNTVQEEYSENSSSISVQGEDVTKYMKISVINVNPALTLDKLEVIDQTPDENIIIWSTILKGLTTPDIIRLVTLGSESVKIKGEGASVAIDGVGFYKLAGEKEDVDIVYDLENKTFLPGEVDRGSEYVANTNVRRADFSAMLGNLFRKNSVHIINPFRKGSPLVGFRPYELSTNSNYSFYQADFKTRRDIAYQSAEDSHFAFYADRNGHIWFHPYRFSASWIFSANIPEVYIIDNESIIDYGFIEDDSSIFTSVYVSTEPDFGLEGAVDIGFYHASLRDDSSVLKYGQRIFVASNPLINTKLAESSQQELTNTQGTTVGEYMDSGWWKVYFDKLVLFIGNSTFGSKFTFTMLSGFDTSRLLRSSGKAYNTSSYHITGDAVDISILYTVDNTWIVKADMEAVMDKTSTLTEKESDIFNLIELFKVFAATNNIKYAPLWKGKPDYNHFQASTRTINTQTTPRVPSRNISPTGVDPQKSLELYAKSLLQRLLASKYQGQVSIGLRPELEPGRPVYIPMRNRLYYVETVDHNISFGGQAKTTLHLSYGRKPWELLPELLTFASKDEVYMTDGKVVSRRVQELDKGKIKLEPISTYKTKQ